MAGGAGVFQDNDIHTNSGAGVEVVGRGAPKVSGNRIYANYVSGVPCLWVARGYSRTTTYAATTPAACPCIGRARACSWTTTSTATPAPAWRRGEGGAPLVTGNRILNNTWGVWVHDLGMGSYLGNDLRGNGGGAWSLDEPSSGLITRSENQE